MLSSPIYLTPLEVAIAEFVGQQRWTDGVRAGADGNKYGFGGDQLELAIDGCLGEMAFAKARNLYWSGAGVGYANEEDVGNVQVRLTDHRNGCLLHRPNEKHHDDPWVLVVRQGDEYHLGGWLYGHELRRPEWLRDPGGRPPAYFAPQESLRPLQPLARS